MTDHKTITGIVIIIVIAVIATGSGILIFNVTEDTTTPNNTESTTGGVIVYEDVKKTNDVVRFVDRDAGTVCYVYSGQSGYAAQGGLSCIPLNETTLTT